MKGRISIRHVLLSTVVMFVLSQVAYADPLTIVTGPGANIVTFQNAHDTATALDFTVFLFSDPPPGIGGGFGGTPFPMTTLLQPDPGGSGFLTVTYDGGPGIPSGGMYTHGFVGFPVGTVFEVRFSYNINGQVVFLDPAVVVSGTPSREGETAAVSEPTTLLLLGTGLAGVAIKARKRFQSRQSRQESQ